MGKEHDASDVWYVTEFRSCRCSPKKYFDHSEQAPPQSPTTKTRHLRKLTLLANGDEVPSSYHRERQLRIHILHGLKIFRRSNTLIQTRVLVMTNHNRNRSKMFRTVANHLQKCMLMMSWKAYLVH